MANKKQQAIDLAIKIVKKHRINLNNIESIEAARVSLDIALNTFGVYPGYQSVAQRALNYLNDENNFIEITEKL